MDAVDATCEALARLPETHVQFTLLRCCLDAAKVMDLLRAAPFGQAAAECERFTRILRDTLSTIVGTPLSDTQWAQASLPIRKGGLGVKDPVLLRLPARIAAVADFVARGSTVLRLPGPVAPLPVDWHVCLTRAVLLLGPIQPLQAWAGDSALLKLADPTHRKQQWWSDAVYSATSVSFQEALQGADAVRFASQCTPHAMAWASVVPAEALRTLIPATDFRCLLRFHLGVPLLPSAGPQCPKCDATLDAFGHHLVCCNRNGIVQRHGAVQDAVFRLAHAAGFTVRKEQMAPDRSRPGDVFVARLDANGPGAVDITVRHTLAPSRPVRRATDVDGWLAAQEREKVAKYAGQCRRLGWTMVPFVVDCYGAFGHEAQAFVASCLKLLLAQKELWARRGAEADAWQTLSLALAREVARQLRVSRFAEEMTADPARELPPDPPRNGSVRVGGTGAHDPYRLIEGAR